MILVDTNVWSEAFRPHPAERVRAWAARNADAMWLSAVVAGELLSGVELMPDGRRKEHLRASYAALLTQFADRIASFDLDAAHQYGRILALQTRLGRNPGTADTQIAATALSLGMALATRNTRHFEGLGIELIDPWQE